MVGTQPHHNQRSPEPSLLSEGGAGFAGLPHRLACSLVALVLALGTFIATPNQGDTSAAAVAVAAAYTPEYAFADPAFENLWNEVDGLTPQQKKAKHMVPSWYFGPTYSEGMTETIENNLYNTQYFDKTRMEKQPDGSVTTGLLATDLINSGADIVAAGDGGSRSLT